MITTVIYIFVVAIIALRYFFVCIYIFIKEKKTTSEKRRQTDWKIPVMELFFNKECLQLYKKCSPLQVFPKTFSQICSYLSKFLDISGKLFSQNTFQWRLLTFAIFLKHSFSLKSYCQGRKLRVWKTEYG